MGTGKPPRQRFWTAGRCNLARKGGSKVHLAVDTLGQLLALHVTAANEQDRDQVEHLAEQILQTTGDEAAAQAAQHGIRLEVVKLPYAKHGFVLLPRRWVVERSFAWLAQFRRLPEPMAGLHFLAVALILLTRFIAFMTQSA